VNHDLYAVLGLNLDADAAAIKRAYRRASKMAHPDMAGGSAAKFALVKLAADVLGDPARRAHYDETGEIEDKPVDNAHAEALAAVAAALEQAFVWCEKNQRKPEQTDIAGRMRTWLGSERDEQSKRIAHCREVERKNLALAKRFDGGPMEQIFAGRIGSLRAQMAGCERAVRNVDAALVLMEDVTYRADAAVGIPQMLLQMQRGSGW
jgi:curved DNA-binding protein CbpA